MGNVTCIWFYEKVVLYQLLLLRQSCALYCAIFRPFTGLSGVVKAHNESVTGFTLEAPCRMEARLKTMN